MTPETRELVQAMLTGMKATVGSLQAQIVTFETLLAQEPDQPHEAPTCPHSGETENIGTFGAPLMQCLQCKTVFVPKEDGEGEDETVDAEPS